MSTSSMSAVPDAGAASLTDDLNEALEIAGAHLRARRLEAAALVYKQVLDVDPMSVAATAGLAAVALVGNRLTEALVLYGKVLRQDPEHVEALTNRGVIYLGVDDPVAAEGSFRQGLAVRPGDIDLLNNLANALGLQGRLEAAAAAYEEGLVRAPDDARLLHGLAAILKRQDPVGHNDRIRDLLAKAIAAQPDHVESLVNLGNLELAARRPEDALRLLDRALRYDPENGITQFNRARALQALDRNDDAVAALQSAALLMEDKATPELALAQHHHACGDVGSAIVHYLRALGHNPARSDGYLGLARAFLHDGKLAKARQALDRAGASDEAAGLRLELDLLDRDEADPWEMLAAAGMVQYQSGAQDPVEAGAGPRSQPPLWDGAPLDGALLVEALSDGPDMLQLARLLPLLRRRAGRLVLRARAPMATLLARVAGVDAVLLPEAPVPEDVAAGVPLMAAPAVLGLPPYELPAEVPYLSGDPARSRAWATAGWFETNALKLGVAWRRKGVRLGAGQDLPLTVVESLLEIDGVQAYSMAVAMNDFERRCLRDFDLVDLAEQAADLEDLLAMIERLDAVVACDGMVAHLAAAAAKPVLLLLPLAPDWRWGRSGATCPFYPTMRLFRQERAGDWTAPVARLQRALRRDFLGLL